MAWGKAGRPVWKECRGYGRTPHRARYSKDFPRVKHTLKSGEVVYYAGSLCRECRNRYGRELRRMNNRLKGKSTRPNDVPWRRHRKEIPSTPFLSWLKAYRLAHGYTLREVCALVGITTRPVRRWRQYGYIAQPETAFKFLEFAEQEYLADKLLFRYLKVEHERRGPRVDSGPFFQWLDDYVVRANTSIESMCRAADVSSRTVRRCRAEGRMELRTAEKFFGAVALPHLTRTLYPREFGKKAA